MVKVLNLAFQGFKVFISPHTWTQTKSASNELKSKVGRMEPPGNPGQFNKDTLSTKRFPITPNGVLGVAPYLLFATSVLGGTFVTSVLGGTIHK